MDVVDRDLEKAEVDANQEQYFPDGTPKNPDKHLPDGTSGQKLDRQDTATTTSSASSASVVREEMGISRANTQRDLERHPTALSRIETHRTQHSQTVGRTITSRQSKKPLPNFGGGKEYPPQLPAQEEYVVEFDGPDDPLHPQNWTLRKK